MMLRTLRLTPLVTLLLVAACQTDPYCLNCTDEDLQPIRLDLTEPSDMATGPDLYGVDMVVPPDLSQCVASGEEVCDNLDNDCNGMIDDVDPSKLQADPQNCGACGNKCNFLVLHMFGDCQMVGSPAAPTCMPTTCLPGYQDIDPSTPGCEYHCVVTNGGVEICDGQDNDCNGTIDDPFGYPDYATDPANCGGCGNTCGLPGANTTCQAGMGGTGQCVVTSCINVPGALGSTFRHNPANDATTGGINITGCEYKCPTPSSTAGDCNPSMNTCTFPGESCNGQDDDCNFVIDDGTLPGVGVPCYDKCPGGVDGPNCGGASQCQPGVTVCSNGGTACSGGAGPGAEICDGKDNNCDGQIDENFGYPLYNTDPNNCGGCYVAADGANGTTSKFSCTAGGQYATWNAVKGCHSDATVQPLGNNEGVCYVVACDEDATGGFRHRALTPSGNSCAATTTKRDGPTGTGCDYACPSWPLKAEVCNGGDDDCDGCADEALTAPEICSTLGACNSNQSCAGPCVAGQCPVVGGGTQACTTVSRFTPTCMGAGGWVCNYSKDRNGVDETTVEFDAGTGALAGAETKCDQKDNNCNNVVDSDGFPLVNYTSPVACTDTQLGLCRRSGSYVCAAPPPPATPWGDPVCNLTSPVVTPQQEVCDGKDNDCDGLTDENKGSDGNANYVLESVVQLTNPVTSTTYFIDLYEASRPDASPSSVGVSTARACGKPGVLPWATLTQTQAATACTAAGMRLCSEDEWVRGCAGAAGNDFPYGNVYDGNKCNGRDWNPACGGADGFEQVQPTATPYGCPTLPGATQCVSADGLIDMSGNIKEWTSTANGGSFVVHGGAYDNIEDGLSCAFDFVSLPPATMLSTVGFRCCSTLDPR
jgi:hypothetical protein